MAARKKKPVVTFVSDLNTPKALQEAMPLPPEPANPPEGMERPMGGIYDPLSALKLAHVSEKIHRLQAQLSGYHLLFESQRREIEEKRHATLTTVDRDLKLAGQEYKSIQKDIEEKHHIDLAQYTFDPDTGMFNQLDGGGEAKQVSEAVAPPPAPTEVKSPETVQ